MSLKWEDKFEEFVALNLPKAPSFHPFFSDALGYTLNSGGKHFRAKLLLGVALAMKKSNLGSNLTLNLSDFSKEKSNLEKNSNLEKSSNLAAQTGDDFLNSCFQIALAIELFHSYSLIHDDLPAMDNSPLRRGQPSLHKKFDETTAILAGDALNTHAFYLISTAKFEPETSLKCCEILSLNGGIKGMVLGQAIDCYFEKTPLNLEQIIFLHENKTGKLIAASMQMGAVIAGASESEAGQIYKIGLKLGLAFQIHDDIIDATKDSQTAGKPTQNDGAKNSFTNLLGIKEAQIYRDKITGEILENLKNSPIFELISNLINQYLKD